MKIYFFLVCVCIYFSILCINSGKSIPLINNASTPPLQLRVANRTVEIDNGIVKLSLTNPTGMINGISYGGVGNVLEEKFSDSDRGYWDITWSYININKFSFYKLESSNFNIITQTEDVIEVSFTSKKESIKKSQVVPLNIDKRFIMLRGVSGFYTYVIFDHPGDAVDLKIDEARLALKLQQNMFHYMAISDEKQRVMPTEADRKSGRVLDYEEAVLLTNGSLKGEVDDKYQYACDTKDNHLHGWISSRPRLGFWLITPSDESRAGGPIKTDLTSHVGPTSLAIFLSTHYAGPNFGVYLDVGELWTKVLGPTFIYLNSGSDNKGVWQDAKRQMETEMKKWPYDFPSSKEFPSAKQRGEIHGRLLVKDKYANTSARWAYVGLASPGDAGSWQDESKGYQFWTRTDENGVFTIKGVRMGIYNLYGWVPGVIGDLRREGDIAVDAGSKIELGNVVYKPPRNGPTLWEIGIADRTAAEFYVPHPSPDSVNKLFLNGKEKFRQYGLWDRYSDIYPHKDLVYTIGKNDYRKDWFFAHVNRRTRNNSYIAATWQISFNLRNELDKTRNYTLRIALASATIAELQVRINNPDSISHFTTGVIGRDNAIARHGIHGRYWLFNVNIWGKLLLHGTNTIYLRQSKDANPFTGVMYDYLRLEGPSTTPRRR